MNRRNRERNREAGAKQCIICLLPGATCSGTRFDRTAAEPLSGTRSDGYDAFPEGIHVGVQDRGASADTLRVNQTANG